MKFNVEMLAFGNGELRPVDVPDDELTGDLNADLELVFHYGQNDFQSLPYPSVSINDVIHYDGKKYKVDFMGFSEVEWKTVSEFLYRTSLPLSRDLYNRSEDIMSRSQLIRELGGKVADEVWVSGQGYTWIYAFPNILRNVECEVLGLVVFERFSEDS